MRESMSSSVAVQRVVQRRARPHSATAGRPPSRIEQQQTLCSTLARAKSTRPKTAVLDHRRQAGLRENRSATNFLWQAEWGDAPSVGTYNVRSAPLGSGWPKQTRPRQTQPLLRAQALATINGVNIPPTSFTSEELYNLKAAARAARARRPGEAVAETLAARRTAPMAALRRAADAKRCTFLMEKRFGGTNFTGTGLEGRGVKAARPFTAEEENDRYERRVRAVARRRAEERVQERHRVRVLRHQYRSQTPGAAATERGGTSGTSVQSAVLHADSTAPRSRAVTPSSAPPSPSPSPSLSPVARARGGKQQRVGTTAPLRAQPPASGAAVPHEEWQTRQQKRREARWYAMQKRRACGRGSSRAAAAASRIGSWRESHAGQRGQAGSAFDGERFPLQSPSPSPSPSSLAAASPAGSHTVSRSVPHVDGSTTASRYGSAVPDSAPASSLMRSRAWVESQACERTVPTAADNDRSMRRRRQMLRDQEDAAAVAALPGVRAVKQVARYPNVDRNDD